MVNTGKQVVSELSSATVILVAVVAESALPVTSPVNAPLKVVALKVPLDELYVKELESVLGASSPVAVVVNTGKQVVSELSSATVMLVAVVAVSALPVKSPVTFPVTGPLKFDAVITPVGACTPELFIVTAEPTVISEKVAPDAPPRTYVLILDAAVLLLVPLPLSSTMNKSSSTISAPISVAPSISI